MGVVKPAQGVSHRGRGCNPPAGIDKPYGIVRGSSTHAILSADGDVAPIGRWRANGVTFVTDEYFALHPFPRDKVFYPRIDLANSTPCRCRKRRVSTAVVANGYQPVRGRRVDRV